MTKWGWASPSHPGSVTWIPGTLEASYARVSADGGQWLLVSSSPVSEYHRVMAETAAANRKGSK